MSRRTSFFWIEHGPEWPIEIDIQSLLSELTTSDFPVRYVTLPESK
jgi:hypothetical protein